MSKETNQYENRPTQQFWGVIGNEVKQVTGYECLPANPGVWWVPDLGYSQHEDYLHKTEGAALNVAITEAEAFERSIQVKLASLREQARQLATTQP